MTLIIHIVRRKVKEIRAYNVVYFVFCVFICELGLSFSFVRQILFIIETMFTEHSHNGRKTRKI